MRTRLAPSPTGALHPGNARTFLITWWLARKIGGSVALRIEDLDGPRIKPAAAGQAIEDLTWLGMNFDDGPVYQSHRRQVYAEAVRKLIEAGAAYPCVCTRRDVESAAGAPHADDGSAVYPGTCRDRFKSVADAARFAGRPPTIRFRVPNRIVSWTDRFTGPMSIDLATLGDFVIAKSDGTPAYQLAVVVDDAEAGVTDVIRGDDLLDSTPRQMLIYEALGLAGRVPSYCHVPLVTGPDGRRLAKRHGDSRLSEYRKNGTPASAVVRWVAGSCGISPVVGVTAGDFIDHFDLPNLPDGPVVFDPAEFG